MSKKKVVVGMSGGVDSSVAALLLKEQGYDVHGIFMKNWDPILNNDYLGNPDIENNICISSKEFEDVRDVCEHIKITYEKIDLTKEYWNEVFNEFINALKLYKTPNPDILCNKKIKFNHFIKYAKKIGADFIATGHYCRLKKKNNRIYLMKAKDKNKDQSYFLSQVESNNLLNVLFPLGELKKSEVRNIALKNGLINANKKDSTGICFIGERNFPKFISNYLKFNPGDIVNQDKKKLGTHKGLYFYTIGQRKNLGIYNFPGPWFVYGKDVKNNILMVADVNNKNLLFSDSCLVDNLVINDYSLLKKCKAKVRYRQNDNIIDDIVFTNYNKSEAMVYFKFPISSVTPGQAIAFYKEDICIGGGNITKAYYNKEIKMYV